MHDVIDSVLCKLTAMIECKNRFNSLEMVSPTSRDYKQSLLHILTIYEGTKSEPRSQAPEAAAL